MSITDHSRIAPSAFHLTFPCPASLPLQEKVAAQPDTEEIAEGKAAHHVAAEYLRGNGKQYPVGRTFEFNGRAWTVDDDMADGAELWADVMGPGCTVEETVHIPAVHPESWGTPDGWTFTPAVYSGKQLATPGHLKVGDYKYGHRFVDAFENLQVGAGYASGILHRLGISPTDTETVVEIIIVQPRSFRAEGPVVRWITTPAGIAALAARVRIAVEQALGKNPAANTGGHCKDCKARAMCGTIRHAAARIVDFSGAIEPAELSTEHAAIELRILHEAMARLDARYTGLYAQLEVAARAGQTVPGWVLEPGQSRLKWSAPLDEIRSMAALLGINIEKPPTADTVLLTPTQAITKAKVPESIVLQYAARPPAGVKLKPASDTKARKIFGSN